MGGGCGRGGAKDVGEGVAGGGGEGWGRGREGGRQGRSGWEGEGWKGRPGGEGVFLVHPNPETSSETYVLMTRCPQSECPLFFKLTHWVRARNSSTFTYLSTFSNPSTFWVDLDSAAGGWPRTQFHNAETIDAAQDGSEGAGGKRKRVQPQPYSPEGCERISQNPEQVKSETVNPARLN